MRLTPGLKLTLGLRDEKMGSNVIERNLVGNDVTKRTPRLLVVRGLDNKAIEKLRVGLSRVLASFNPNSVGIL